MKSYQNEKHADYFIDAAQGRQLGYPLRRIRQGRGHDQFIQPNDLSKLAGPLAWDEEMTDKFYEKTLATERK